ncbi:MAG: hypothetical protein KTR30_12400 [Saprospiraceae bacterium]|nr:hypothetical protein [Saprospiraceae bacterium]
MAKFFRRVRQRLLSGNRFSKYFLYAVGEIFLVVVGILIALQVNTINERKNRYEKQRDYLLLIKKEMVNNLNAILQQKELLLSIMDDQKRLISLFDSTSLTINETELSGIMGGAFLQEVGFTYENGALSELIASGGLKNIVNSEIRNVLASWDGRVTKVLQQEKAVNAYQKKSSLYLEQYGDFRTIFDNAGVSAWLKIDESSHHNSNLKLLQQQAFENIVILYLATAHTLYYVKYPELEQDIKELIQWIEVDVYNSILSQ